MPCNACGDHSFQKSNGPELQPTLIVGTVGVPGGVLVPHLARNTGVISGHVVVNVVGVACVIQTVLTVDKSNVLSSDVSAQGIDERMTNVHYYY